MDIIIISGRVLYGCPPGVGKVMRRPRSVTLLQKGGELFRADIGISQKFSELPFSENVMPGYCQWFLALVWMHQTDMAASLPHNLISKFF